METRIRESERRYRTILDSIDEGYFEVDLSGNFRFASDCFCKLAGKSKEELLQMSYLDYIDEMAAKKINGIFGEIHRTGIPAKRIEHEIVMPRGERRYHELSASLKKDQTGKPVGFRGIVSDITERKKAQEEAEILQARIQKAEKIETIGILAGGVAHDLINILSSIVSYPDMLLMQLPSDSPLRDPLSTIKESGKKAAAIVYDLLALAKRRDSSREVLNINDIIYEYLRSPEHEKLRSFHQRVLLETELKKNLMNIFGSPVHLFKMVMNLISNAAEAMPDGGKILVSTENRHIDEPIGGSEHLKAGDYSVLTVSDTGVGISPADIEKIFEPFYTKKVMGRSGTGLGMAVVQGTVEDHNGHIDVKSNEGEGTVFTICFPATRKSISRDSPLLSIEQIKGRGESILVVDDVEDQREIACSVLTQLGYSVSTVSSGEEAVDYVKKTPVDLLILDMMMDTGIDGLETYKRILELHPGQKAIIVSGYSETERIKKAQKLGIGQYIKKPYTLKSIGKAIRTELEKKRFKSSIFI
jgi:PAS domain S-box-containing protein